QGELPVGEGAGAGKAGGDMAVGLAVDALLGLALGAAALLDGLALFHHDDVLLAALLQHLNGGKDARRTCADDDDICIHCVPPSQVAGEFPWLGRMVPGCVDESLIPLPGQIGRKGEREIAFSWACRRGTGRHRSAERIYLRTAKNRPIFGCGSAGRSKTPNTRQLPVLSLLPN